MYKAFQLQCEGKSIAAWAQFASAYEHAKSSGEDVRRLQIIEQILVWYRMYGTASRLFTQQPTGYDKIIGEYQRSYGYYPRMYTEPYGYRSELGKTPEQAALTRDFMVAVGEIIAGVFCIGVGTPFGYALGGAALADGLSRSWGVINQTWAQHERAYLDWKKCEESMKKTENF